MRRILFLAPLLIPVAALASACTEEDPISTFPEPDAGAFDGKTSGDVIGAGPYSDFPAEPIIETTDGGGGGSAPTNSKDLFGAAQGAPSGGPCLAEPEIDSLFPQNWLRPRFRWVAAAGENLFELRVHAENQVNDLVVYTTKTSWVMPQEMWDSLSGHSPDVPITVSVRGGVLTGGTLADVALGSQGPIGIAPVQAPGSVVYWTTVPDPMLKGFKIGDEGVVDVLSPPQVKERPGTTCIGCHTSTPDGQYAAFEILEQSEPTYNHNSIGNVAPGETGNVPPFMTSFGKAALNSFAGVPALSKAHWSTGDRIELLADDKGVLHWVNLEGTSDATATGVIPRGGKDTARATLPSWSHDGRTIVYVSTEGNTPDGRAANGPMDLFTMHYNNKAGGDAEPLKGASDPDFNEFYPAISPDDQLVAFDRVPVEENVYANANDEIYVLPLAGGTATRLPANDPPQCGTTKSPGVMNSWPKWAPEVGKFGGRSFYWLVFSSTRFDKSGNVPQLFVTGIVVDAQGNTKAYKSLYLWNQPSGEHNHTPAWDVFNIPTLPPR
jgi:hypothetical protein